MDASVRRHHLALNITIAGSQGVLAPSLTGAQPATFKLNGKPIRPLGSELEAISLRTIAFRVRTSSIRTTIRRAPTTCTQSIAIRRMTTDVRRRSNERKTTAAIAARVLLIGKAASAHRSMSKSSLPGGGSCPSADAADPVEWTFERVLNVEAPVDMIERVRSACASDATTER